MRIKGEKEKGIIAKEERTCSFVMELWRREQTNYSTYAKHLKKRVDKKLTKKRNHMH